MVFSLKVCVVVGNAASLYILNVGVCISSGVGWALSTLVWVKMPLLVASGLDWMGFTGPFPPQHSVMVSADLPSCHL